MFANRVVSRLCGTIYQTRRCFTQIARMRRAIIPATNNSLLVNSPIQFTLANMSGDSSIYKNATYEDVKALENNSSVLLVDVREVKELQETGVIPGSINIPLGEVQNVFQNTSPEDFKEKYGREKPSFDFPLVFSCRSGRRSVTAIETVAKLGYTDLTNYAGGWLDWEEHIKST